MTGPNLHLNSSLGSFLVGLMLSTMLYITSSTTVKTSGFSKYWTLDTMVTAADIQFIWKLVVTNHASPSTLFPLARYVTGHRAESVDWLNVDTGAAP
ncbi:hypothetical protein IEO21_09342 [Rhodonia placenta]|uniref:Uncharacterized protein n=1 Tax=Rhodonia placenta TaxID=104341 RepID=A0A8H7NUN2_9APHY|nr:hypothetical protein IEO21_09342 [Postia placenta]